MGDYSDLLKQVSIFQGLGTPDLDALEVLLHRREYHKDATIVSQADAGNSLFIINSGKVKVVLYGESGREITLSLFRTGDFFGEISLLLGEPPIADVVATTPVQALQMAGPDLRDFLLAYPPIMYRMLQSVSRRLDSANRRG